MYRKTQNVILLIDTSTSMNGTPINKIKESIQILSSNLNKYNTFYTNVNLTIIAFNDQAKFISKNKIKYLDANGLTNLADAYKKLNIMLTKHKTFDFKPIILLLCDGKPNLDNEKIPLKKLYENKNFRNSLRLSIAYGTQNYSALKTLYDFSGCKDNVLTCSNINTISKIIEKCLPKILHQQAYYKSKTIKLTSILSQT